MGAGVSAGAAGNGCGGGTADTTPPFRVPQTPQNIQSIPGCTSKQVGHVGTGHVGAIAVCTDGDGNVDWGGGDMGPEEKDDCGSLVAAIAADDDNTLNFST